MRLILILIFLCNHLFSVNAQRNVVQIINKKKSYKYEHPIPFNPRTYVCAKVIKPIVVDGKIESEEWINSSWTTDFTDIEGILKPKPFLNTKSKMAWDDQYFYFAALMEEPHIWATLTKRDAIMYHDDDFEIFIDPDGDGHNYFEFEMNAFNAIWDLLMLYPYHMDDRRNFVMAWDVNEIQSAVHLEGSINDPTDMDSSWSVEVAIPWTAFRDLKKGNFKPKIGEHWRINFSRVDWTMNIENRKYVKRQDKNGKRLSENNWVWSPTGYINMHKPETWGYVQFAEHDEEEFVVKKEEKVKWALWQLFYQVKECAEEKTAPCDKDQFTIPKCDIANYNFSPTISMTDYGFEISVKSWDGSIFNINELGLISLHKE